MELLEDIKNNIYRKKTLNLCCEYREFVDDKNIVDLMLCLKSNNYIKKLSLSYSNIGDESAKLIASVDFLEAVDVSNTEIGKIGFQVLLMSPIKDLQMN